MLLSFANLESVKSHAMVRMCFSRLHIEVGLELKIGDFWEMCMSHAYTIERCYIRKQEQSSLDSKMDDNLIRLIN